MKNTNSNEDFNPDKLPNFQVPKQLKNLLEESSYNGDYIVFFRAKDGVQPLVHCEDSITLQGFMNHISIYTNAVLQANAEMIGNNIIDNILGDEDGEFGED